MCRGRADLIAVDHLFRLGRNTREMLEVVDKLSAAGGHFFEADRLLDTTGPVGRLMFTMIAAVGEFHVRDMSRKIVDGLNAARARGRKIGRPRSIDYARTDEAHTLRRRGRTWGQIAYELGGSAGAWSRRCSRTPAPAGLSATDRG